MIICSARCEAYADMAIRERSVCRMEIPYGTSLMVTTIYYHSIQTRPIWVSSLSKTSYTIGPPGTGHGTKVNMTDGCQTKALQQ